MIKALFFTLAAVALLSSSLRAEIGEKKSPNLIVIMADDLGYADIGFNGCRDIRTPHIDSIAAGGVRFTNAYVSYSVCSPSRAGFITGRYSQRFGYERNVQYRPNDPNMGLPTGETTIADSLGKVGYQCGIVGKWHLGANAVHHPLARGFHQFHGHLGGGHRYLPKDLTIKHSEAAKGEAESYRTWILHNRTPVKPTKYLTDDFSDAAVRFVEGNEDKPFFLFLSYNAPHLPLQATAKYLARFPNIKDKRRRTYAAMVSAVDDGVGRVLGKLRELKLLDNTMIFFLSDNGGPVTKNASRNTPLRGAKGDVWEGGFRVPFAVQWRRGFPKGKVYDKPVSSLDIFATIAALSDAPVDPKRPLDGVNLTPYVTGEKTGAPHATIYLRKSDQRSFAVRHGDHKLVVFQNGRTRSLYNLANDIGETTDTKKKSPGIAARLERLRTEWNAQLIEPVFKGLIHTEAWKRRRERENKKKAAGKRTQ